MEEENEFLEVKFKEGGFIKKVKWVEGNKVYSLDKDSKLKVKQRSVTKKPPKPKE